MREGSSGAVIVARPHNRVDQRRDRAAMDDAGLGIADEALVIGQLHDRHAARRMHQLDAELGHVRNDADIFLDQLFGDGDARRRGHSGARARNGARYCALSETGTSLVRVGRQGQFGIMSEPGPAGAKRNPTGQSVGPSVYKVPAGDDRERLVCAECGYIHYENPKIVVRWDPGDRVLLASAIHPRRGYGLSGRTRGERDVFDGARREALEACAEIELGDLFAVYNFRAFAVHLFFRDRLSTRRWRAGREHEVRLFRLGRVPMPPRFPTTRWASRISRDAGERPSRCARTRGYWGDLVKG